MQGGARNGPRLQHHAWQPSTTLQSACPRERATQAGVSCQETSIQEIDPRSLYPAPLKLTARHQSKPSLVAIMEAVSANAGALAARLAAQDGAIDPADAEALGTACVKLQENNRALKAFIAKSDAEAAYEAMHGGFLGIGCNDSKLIACLCTRTKSQLQRTAAQYQALYSRDLRKDVKSETSGYYGKLMKYALSEPGVYFADMIDFACQGFGASETGLIELIVTKSHKQIQDGKAVWERRHDKSMIDYLDKERRSTHAAIM